MACRVLALMVLAGLSLGLARGAEAQDFSFSIGHGHHHHGWHHGWQYDHSWHDPWYWGPHVDYVYVAPPRPRVVYVQPPEREVRVEAAAPLAMNEPKWSAAAASTRTASTTTLQIWNSSGQKIPVAFLVDSKEIELSDGQSHSLHGATQRVVEFDRGGTFGTARYALTDGQYEFVITGRGWDLVRKKTAASGISLKPLVKKNALPGDTVTR